MASENYGIVGRHYSTFRQPDPRIARAIHAELDGIDSIVNIGAGTGSYEPLDKLVAAVEPSDTMIAQRIDRDNTKIYRAFAENLPFESSSFDAALAILTIHHWNNWQKGLQEALRVAKFKVVLFTWVGMPKGFWLFDYFPEIEHIDKALFPSVEQLSTVLGNVDVKTVPIPAGCKDGFMCAYWARPENYLNSRARSTISTFSRIGDVEEGVKKLEKDIESGEWQNKYGYLQDLPELDFGYRLIVSNKNAYQGARSDSSYVALRFRRTALTL
jgi:SAM-dependent methyltransferase